MISGLRVWAATGSGRGEIVHSLDHDGWRLDLELPFADRADVDVARRGDELLITAGPYRRALVLPDTLRRRAVTGASLRAGTLEVAFGAERVVPDARQEAHGT